MSGGSRPDLLFLSHRVPFPPHSGAAIRTLNILRLLARDFRISGLCFHRPDRASVSLASRMEEIGRYGPFEAVSIPQCHSRARLLADHARSVLTRRAYTWYVHQSTEALDRVRQLLACRAFDLVHVDSLDLVRLLPLVAHLPVVCTHHNVESELLARRARSERKTLRRAYLLHQAALIRKAEAEWAPRVALNVVVSPEDGDELGRIAPGAATAVIPNGVDTDFFRPAPQDIDQSQAGCVFVGGTSWHPNRDALVWFVQDILPLLRASGMTELVTWVGSVTPEEIRRYEDVAGFRVTGYVEDIRPYVHAAACFIAPLRFGGGTRLKILDAWAMAKAVVSTPAGAEGLGATSGQHLLLAEDPRGFTEAILRVLRDPVLRQRLGAEGRGLAEKRFSWEVTGRHIRDVYLSVMLGTTNP